MFHSTISWYPWNLSNILTMENLTSSPSLCWNQYIELFANNSPLHCGVKNSWNIKEQPYLPAAGAAAAAVCFSPLQNTHLSKQSKEILPHRHTFSGRHTQTHGNDDDVQVVNNFIISYTHILPYLWSSLPPDKITHTHTCVLYVLS